MQAKEKTSIEYYLFDKKLPNKIVVFGSWLESRQFVKYRQAGSCYSDSELIYSFTLTSSSKTCGLHVVGFSLWVFAGLSLVEGIEKTQEVAHQLAGAQSSSWPASEQTSHSFCGLFFLRFHISFKLNCTLGRLSLRLVLLVGIFGVTRESSYFAIAFFSNVLHYFTVIEPTHQFILWRYLPLMLCLDVPLCKVRWLGQQKYIRY